MQFSSLGWEDALEEEMETHSCVLAWRRTEEPGGLWSMGLPKELDMTEHTHGCLISCK